MTEQQFWEIIEKSWADAPNLNQKRINATKTNEEELLSDLHNLFENEILDNFSTRLFELNKIDLTAFIHILEEKIYDIDRAEIHDYTDGSDDGFLYCRCFIVAMGQSYYDMIDDCPEKAKMDFEAESFGFIAYEVYERKFKEEFNRYEFHSMESVSNTKEWPDD